MLNESEEERLLFLLQTDRTKVVKGMIVNPTAYAITYLWLAEKLKECNDELKEIMNSVENLQKLKVTRRDDRMFQNQKCPHGYKYGDHHWFSCMNIDPFEEEKEIPAVYKNPKNEISDRCYPR